MNSAALVTGASRGIGRGIALELARLGYDLVINFAANHSAANQTSTDCIAAAREKGFSIRAEVLQADISSKSDRTKLVDFARDTFGRLDLLVNNAGIAPQVRTDILEADEKSFDRLIDINVKAPYFLTQSVAKWMIEQRKALNTDYHPKIVTITSVSSYTASINRGDYCIAKAALSMITPLFAARLAAHRINVYELRPGIIATDMTDPVKDNYDKLISTGLTPIARWGQPEDVGKAVAAIAQNLFPFSTGEVMNIDGGFHLRVL